MWGAQVDVNSNRTHVLEGHQQIVRERVSGSSTTTARSRNAFSCAALAGAYGDGKVTTSTHATTSTAALNLNTSARSDHCTRMPDVVMCHHQ
jgi:hypothetical protein